MMGRDFRAREGNGLRGMRERVEMLGRHAGAHDRLGDNAGPSPCHSNETVSQETERKLESSEKKVKDNRKTSRERSASCSQRIKAWCWARWRRCSRSKGTFLSLHRRKWKEALDAVLAHKPDVFITDIEMPHMSGLDVAAELKRRETGTRVVIVTTFARAGYLRRALEAGASGYLLKDMRAEELADAVRRVHQGLRVIHPELATEAWGEMDP